MVSNAGAAWQGNIGEVDEKTLRESFELNFFAHQKVAQAAVKIMLAQGTGGCLLFNVSKQAVNPGAEFRTLRPAQGGDACFWSGNTRSITAPTASAPMRVNADRIRSGLLTDDFIKERAEGARRHREGLHERQPAGREVTAEDVAQAFLAQALALKTTADVTTVDGGNIAAALR